MTVFDIRYQSFDNLEIIHLLEFIIQKKNAELHLIYGVSKFITEVGRVDVDQNQISDGSSQLHHYPLPFIVGVDADSVFRFEVEGF